MTALALARIPAARPKPLPTTVEGPPQERTLWPWLLLAIGLAPLVLVGLIVCVAFDVELGDAS